MAFHWSSPFQPPKSFADVQTMFDSLVQALGTQFSSLVAGPDHLGYGVVNVTITNGVEASATFAHGLGFTPARVVATVMTDPSGRDDYIADVVTWDSTNMTISARGGAAEQFPLANPTSVAVNFIAVG